ncbi:MAG TPA: type VI secretion system protein ImpL [Geobacter sp.]|nr:type VI secretion system protein ImpL [Geobacter sp.]
MTRDTMLTYAKYVLFGAALIPFLVIAYVMFPLLSWSWRIGLFLPLLVLPLWGALVLIKKALSGRNKIESGAEAAGEEPSRVAELQGSCQRAVQALCASHLKDEGDPLYVLPWYLVIGESGSGKSTAIKMAGLSSPFVDHSDGSGAATRNCDWSFYDQGILIDTAGRYTVQADRERDNEEWRKLLALLLRYRRKEPIDGLIVTVAADRLAAGGCQELENYGRQLRLRIDELMSHLGYRFPVYLLVTKCDLVHGMPQFFARLPEQTLDQPMGLANVEMSSDVPAFIGRLSASLSQRLRSLRLLIVHQRDGKSAGSSLLLFPDAMRGLKPGLDFLAAAAFAENHYQETPLLRGIYFCSASPCAPSGHGLFLHDFFEKVLPRDRGLATPTARTGRWRQVGEKVALLSWLVIAASLCGLLSCSFLKNMAVVREASVLVAKTPELHGDFAEDLAAMERMASTIGSIEQRNRDWWVPRFGLNRSQEVEEALKARYCRQFRDRFLVFFDRDMTAAMAAFSLNTPNDLFGRYVMHLSRRINLLKGCLAGNPLSAEAPLPDYPAREPAAEGSSDPSFGKLYLNYVSWRSERQELDKELKQLQSLLKQAFVRKGTDLAWMLEFVDRHEPKAAISLKDFWGGSKALAAEPIIPPSFTKKGKHFVNGLLNEVGTAYPEPMVLEREKEGFIVWYRDACFAAWQKFAWQLPKGEQRLSGLKEWRIAAAGMAGETGPYFHFMSTAADELQAFAGAENLPLWFIELYRFQVLKARKQPAGYASAVEQGKAYADRLGRMVGKQGSAPSSLAGAEVAREYLNAVEHIAPVAKSRSLAHQMALQAFTDSPEVGKSPLYQAADAVQRLNALLAQGQGDDTFSRLISGPITFYGTFVRMETACSLQSQWEEKVLKEVQGASDPQTLNYLLGKDGPVWKFVGAFADPFLGWSQARGYYAKSALGGSVPFRPEFYSFLARGAKAKIAAAAPGKPSYQVTIKGFPTDANSEARTKPHSTRLELQCATGSQVISNLNYPVSKPFVWSPSTCGDVLLQIDIGDTVLTKRYTGAQAFADFLRDFPKGRRTFYPKQFPGERQALERMGIRFIRVNYQLLGAADVVAGPADSLPTRIPAKITDCWD